MADVEPPPADTSQTMSNSASMAADGGKPWERPWTVEEMRKEATNWSLSGDAGLLLYLKDFSQKMISRVHEIEKEVDGLMHDSKMTGVRANNVFNDFIMLANTQFVENRVYDEDVSQEETAKAGEGNDVKEKTREQRESELIPKVKEALELGINVIDQAFEQLDSHVADSDSEEEETGYRADPLLEAKDPYINRLLPLMIGTPKFMEDDSVGLAEEESEEEESDHGSLSESDSDKEDEEDEEGKMESSEEFSESEEESGSDKPVKNQYSKDSESEGSDLFGEEDEKESGRESDDEEEEEEPTPKKPSAPMDFASELAKKLGGPTAPAQESDEEGEPVQERKETKHKEKKKREKKESTSSSKTKSKRKEKIEEEPFPAEEEEDSPFGNKGGLFSGTSKGLFDDSEEEEEGGLFGTQSVSEKKTSKKIIESDKEEEEEKPKERKKTGSSKKPKGGVPMFGEDDQDEMFSEKKTEKKKSSSLAPSGGGGLFDNEDEEDDLFSSAAPKASKEKPTKKETGGGGGLFDEEEEEDLFSEANKEEPKKEETTPPAKQENKKKLPPGAVPMFGGGNPLAAALKKQKKQDSDEEDNEWSDNEKPRTASVKSSQSATSINSASKITAVSKANKPSPSPSSNSLFDDDGDDNALFAAPVKPRADSKSKGKPTKSLFDDNDGDLFSSKPTKKTAEKKPQQSGALFDDEEDEDLFAKPKDSGKKKPVGGVALFGNDILSKKDKPVEKEPEKSAKTSKAAKQTLSLFDDEEDEEEGDIFGAPTSKTASAKPTSASKAKDLFADGDDMFGEEESPEVDIFNQQKAAPKMNKDSSVPVTKAAAPNLFDEDDAGVFGTTQTTKTNSVDVGGVTTEESTDTPDKAIETKPRKPVGGVSMFGGMDPMTALKNKGKKEKEVKEVTPPPKEDSDEEDTSDRPEPPPLEEPKTEKKSQSADPLFGGEDDEDDDLFASAQKDEPEEKEEAKPRKPVGGVSMFGGFDPMAALKNKGKKAEVVKGLTPSPDEVKGVTPPPDKVKESEDEDRIEPPPLHLPEPSKKTKAVDPLFGEDEDDDLFKVSPVKNISTTRPSKPSITPKPIIPSKSKNSKPEPSKKANLFGSPKSDEDDLFSSSSKPPSKESPTSPLGNSPRKPAGGVSMFGGVDPFGVSKKSDSSPDSASTGGDGDKKPEPVSPVSVGNKMPGKIGKLQMNLGINPAAMLPGAAPPVKEPEVVAVGFDTPAQANTLHSANKSRAKIQAKRRPPSRKGRQGGGPGGDSAPSVASPPPQVETPPVESRVPQPTSDLFGNDDLLGETDTNNAFMAPPPVPDNYEEENEDIFSSTRKKNTIMSDDDLFNPVISSASKPKSVINSVNDDDDDIFGSSTVKNTPKFVSKRKVENDTKSPVVNGVEDVLSEKSQPSKVVEPEDEDLFAAKPKVKKPTDFEKLLDDKPEETKTETKPAAVEEDLFSDSTLNKKTESKPQKPEATDDDIFADSSLNKKASKATKSEENKINEDDDLFGKPAQKSKKPSKARPKTKDEDLFKDNTDIFADVPAAKPREKKKKKTTEKKSVFKDDDDDIFATKPSKPKAKKEKKTEAPKKTATDVTDIFDDPLS